MSVARRSVAGALLVSLVAAFVLALAPPASAHANLIGTDPAEGAVLTTAPEQVVLTFDEGVRGVPDGIQVFDSQGGPVDASPTVQGTALTVALAEPLGEGTTVIVWRVVSEDGHPISGSLTFSVGAPTSDFTPPVTEASGTPDVPRMLTLARWVGYLSLFLASGLVAFVALFLPAEQGADAVRRRVGRILRWPALVVVVSWLSMVPLTATYLVDGGWDALVGGDAWAALPWSEYAVPLAVVGWTVLAVVLLGRGGLTPPRRLGSVGAAAIAAAAPALTGHTRAASPELLVVGADALHLLSGSVWLGGLAGLALTLPALAGQGALAAETLARFSTAAAGVLAALVATGSVLAWRILGSWGALVDTTYGRLLLVKVFIVVVAMAIAAWNRWSLLPRLQQAAKAGGQGRVTRTRPVVRASAVEGVALVAVLLVTGFLVDKSPEPEPAVAAAGEQETEADAGTTTLGDIEVRADLTPLTRGPNTVTLRLTTPDGEPTEGVAPPVVRLTSDRVDLGEVPLTPVSVGLYTTEIVLPSAGEWRMQVSLRVSEFANPVGELEFVVTG